MSRIGTAAQRGLTVEDLTPEEIAELNERRRPFGTACDGAVLLSEPLPPTAEELERWRRGGALVAAELRAWAKRDSDGWSVAARRQAAERRTFVLPKNRGKLNLGGPKP